MGRKACVAEFMSQGEPTAARCLALGEHNSLALADVEPEPQKSPDAVLVNRNTALLSQEVYTDGNIVFHRVDPADPAGVVLRVIHGWSDFLWKSKYFAKSFTFSRSS